MIRLVLPLSVVLALSVPADAQKPNNNGRGGQPKAEQAVTVSFGATAEREIRSYFQSNPMTPQSLPPGIAKNLARGKPLPPGIAKRDLPGPLTSKLPVYEGHEVVIIDRDAILINTATQVIVDILTRVF